MKWTKFIAWAPHWQDAHFGVTEDEAWERACYPHDPDHPKLGKQSLLDAGWRVDAFPFSVEALPRGKRGKPITQDREAKGYSRASRALS